MPRRIVCLSAEAADIFARIGAWDRLVGVTVFFEKPAHLPAVPVVSGFASANLQKIEELAPDLTITYSDVQAGLAADLIRLGLPVLALNHHSLEEIPDVIRMLGNLTDCSTQAKEHADVFQGELRLLTKSDSRRPRVYFEEWPGPLIHGGRWISEAIQLAGGQDIFALSQSSKAESRICQPDEIARLNPEVILASWCGRPVDFEAMRGRHGWSEISAVRNNALYELRGADILQVGPGVLRGIRLMQDAVARCRADFE